VDDDGRTAVAIVNVDVRNDADPPTVTTAALLRPSSKSRSILASTFVEPDIAGARAGSNTSLFYWVEGSRDQNQQAAVRYTIFRGNDGGTAPVAITGGYRPTASPGHYTYSGSFFPGDGSANYLVQWPEATTINAAIVTVPPAPGPERFNAVWTKSTEERPAVWGWARAHLDGKAQELAAQGFRLQDLNAFVLPGQGERFNAIWVKSQEERPAVWGWARTDFEAKAQELARKGFRLMMLNAFVLPGQGERFNAIWVKSQEERPAVWGWARAHLDGKAQELAAQGFRLQNINAFVLPGQGERFNAIWVKSQEERPAVWG
jgi:hypothetical protein